jgi:hypothetical protein
MSVGSGESFKQMVNNCVLRVIGTWLWCKSVSPVWDGWFCHAF